MPSAPSPQQTGRRLRVWDLPTRLMHWGLAGSVLGALICVEIGGNLMAWHLRFGYSALAILAARLVWGLIGPHYARFSSFPPNPLRALVYLKQGAHGFFAGHNPAGALAVYAMLTVLAMQAGSGLFTTDEILWEGALAKLVSADFVAQASWLHHLNANLVYLLLALHLAAVLFHSRFRREPLVSAMVFGDRPAPPENSDKPASDDKRERVIGLTVLALSGILTWWMVSKFG